MTEKCCLCPHKCGVDREKNFGRCHSLSEMRICRIAPHFYEEPPISGTKGSGTIFFGGCSLDCEFCQNYKISKSYAGIPYSPEKLADELKKLEESGVHNVNFVTPTHFSDKIRLALDIYRPKIPIIYNTSGYELPSLITELLPYVDIFLTDMKYSSDDVSKKYSCCSDYVGFCKESTDIMIKNKPLVFDGDLMKQGVIVRHLVLPGELKNTFGVIDYFTRYKGKAYLSVMSQFTPEYRSSIKRGLTPLEYKIVLRKIIESGIDECFVQELSSASEEYIPEFNTGNET